MILCEDILLYIYEFLSIKDLKSCSKYHWERFLEQDQLLKNYHLSIKNLNDLECQRTLLKKRYIEKKSRHPMPLYFSNFRDVEKYNDAKYDHFEEIGDYITMLNHMNSKINRARSRVLKITNSLQYRLHTSKKQCHTGWNLGIPNPPPSLYIT